jgi:hypothetical protein
MNVSTAEAFSMFKGWMESKATLFVTGTFGPASLGPRFKARVLSVSRSSEKVSLVTLGLPMETTEMVIDLKGVVFAAEPNSADASKESLVLSARSPSGGIAFFVESPLPNKR